MKTPIYNMLTLYIYTPLFNDYHAYNFIHVFLLLIVSYSRSVNDLIAHQLHWPQHKGLQMRHGIYLLSHLQLVARRTISLILLTTLRRISGVSNKGQPSATRWQQNAITCLPIPPVLGTLQFFLLSKVAIMAIMIRVILKNPESEK